VPNSLWQYFSSLARYTTQFENNNQCTFITRNKQNNGDWECTGDWAILILFGYHCVISQQRVWNGKLEVLTYQTRDTRLIIEPLGASVDCPTALVNATAIPLQSTLHVMHLIKSTICKLTLSITTCDNKKFHSSRILSVLPEEVILLPPLQRLMFKHSTFLSRQGISAILYWITM